MKDNRVVKTVRTLSVFRRMLKQTSSGRKIQFAVLLIVKIIVGLWESLTVACIAAFASWLVDIEAVGESRLYRFIEIHIPRLLPQTPGDLVIGGTLAITLLILLRNGTRLLSLFLSNRFANQLQADVGIRILETVFTRPYTWFIAQQPSDIIQIFQWRMNYGGFLQLYLELMTRIIVIAALLSTLFISNIQLSLPILGTLGILSLIIFKATQPELDEASNQIKNLRKRAFHEISSSTHGHKDVRLHKAEAFIINRMKNSFTEIVQARVRQAFYQSSPSLVLEILSFSILSVAIIILVTSSGNDIGLILGLMAMLAIVSWRITPLVSHVLHDQASLRTSIPYVEHVLDFIGEGDNAYQINTDSPEMEESMHFSTLELRYVGFDYPGCGKTILKNVSFSVHRGDKIGIIGHSGGGKTTLVDIIAGLLPATDGSVLINGRISGVKDMGPWQNTIAYLPQHPYIFPGTIVDNVAFGISPERVDPGRVASIIDSLELNDIISRNELDREFINERGKNISGGQAQRLSLARVIYTMKDFIIIDEGTSALDAPLEKKVIEIIMKAREDMTLIIITHRFESLSFCDRILWLEDGTVRMFDDAEKVIDAYRSEI